MKKLLRSEYVTPPNCITAVRMVGTVVLLFTAPLSAAFYALYVLCGVTDALDGWVARATNSSTELGAKLDSIADLLFYLVLLVKLLPTLWRVLPSWIWYLLGGALVLRLASYLTAAVKFKRFASVHTRLNKLTGLAVFLLPCAMLLPWLTGYCVFACLLAAAASAQELFLHLSRNTYQTNKKALF
jgi:CDP-diacylglycerol--glycerol-3-phosphate 3-phosphatidyltransferase